MSAELVPRMRSVVLAAFALTLAFPAASGAQTCQAPPGTSAIDEYCESIPAADGVRAPGERTAAGPGIARETQRTLRAAGPEGEALVQLAGPPAPGRSDRPRPRPDLPAASPAEERHDARRGPIAAVGAAAETVATTREGLPWILAGLAAMLASMAVARRRSSSP